MSHYEERLERDLQAVRDHVRALGNDVQDALGGAVRAMLSLDRTRAHQIVLGDLKVNRAVRSIDAMCHAFVARHLPSAGILRYISSVLRLSVALERIGDYAVTVARETVQLSAAPPDAVRSDIEMIGDQSQRMLEAAMRAFNEGSAERAKGTMGLASQIGSSFQKIFDDLVREGTEGSRPIRDLFALLVVFNRLERVSDQAKNICEETVFASTGQTKEPKVYQVLFVDRHNSGASQLAEAFARKAYPTSGEYSSAGWEPADNVDAEVQDIAQRHGLDVTRARPRSLPQSREELAGYHAIVLLEPDGEAQIEEVPFHTILLTWPLDEAPEGESSLTGKFMEIRHRVQELMEAMHGPDAN